MLLEWEVELVSTWGNMISRCMDQKHSSYQKYGARGIAVCERWQVFSNFTSDMGPRPNGHTLDRIDSAGNYEPDNCRWATSSQQNRNRRTNRRLTANGETKLVIEWAESTGLPKQTIANRLKAGWTAEEAVSPRRLGPHGVPVRAIEIDGVTKCISEWSRESGVGVPTINHRLRQGWPYRHNLSTCSTTHTTNILILSAICTWR